MMTTNTPLKPAHMTTRGFALAAAMACIAGCSDNDASADAAPLDAPRIDAQAPPDADGATFALTPDSLLFYSLPIGSIRYAVSGYEPVTDSCVTLVWYISDTSTQFDPLCGTQPDDPPFADPYAIVAPPTPAGDPPDGPIYGARMCEVWNYGPNATIQALTGCATFNRQPGVGTVDLQVTIASDQLSGTLSLQGSSSP